MPLKHNKNNSNTTRVKHAPKKILLGREKTQIERKSTKTEEENEEHPMREREEERRVDERNAQSNRDERDENSERHIHMLFALATHG